MDGNADISIITKLPYLPGPERAGNDKAVVEHNEIRILCIENMFEKGKDVAFSSLFSAVLAPEGMVQ